MRIHSIALLALLVCLPLISAAQQKSVADSAKPQDKIQSAEKFEQTITKKVSLNYLAYVPKDYDAKSGKRWPTILFLHGAGERGTNVWRADFHGPSKYIVDHPEFPFILITPQCPAGETWSNEALLALLDEIEKKYAVDQTRVYLTGLSMGGYGTWALGMKYPERFAAIVPICGGGNTIDIILAGKGYAPEKLAALKTLGVWAFHGGKDTVVPMSESEHMIKALECAGMDMTKVKFTIYPEKQHDAWSETYANPELYDWLLQHKRPNRAGN